ncbi:GNAT family N-acetyltransferase [Rothia nasimurium]|uniref:GNAT family N-acetyltransferase n=1 Tax=Rothia nasimurium TaxID=85336 RepID=UPI001F38EE90|nr:GNAT family N-acetyltransferase [Rothia nasimurium]
MIQIETLALAQADQVQELYDQNPDYFLRISGRPAEPGSALENLTVFPPGLSHSPVLLGAFDDGRLVGVLIAVLGFPSEEFAHVALALVDEQARGRGVGRALHDVYLGAVRQHLNISTLRLGIVATNAAVAEPFWRALGYTPSAEVKDFSQGDVVSTVEVFTRPVG